VAAKFGIENSVLIDFKPLFHGAPIPPCDDKNIVICDFCPSKEDIQNILTRAKSLRILDHHDGSEDVMKEFSEYTIYSKTSSGVGLAWSFFNPKKFQPKWVMAIEDRDLYLFKYIFTKPLCAYIYSNAGLQNIPKFILVVNYVSTQAGYDIAIAEGSAIVEYQKSVIESMVRNFVQTKFCGILTGVINTDRDIVSDACDGFLQAKKNDGYKLSLSFTYRGIDKSWAVSIRSYKGSGVLCYDIAKKFGGGGHAEAAGFVVPYKDANGVVQYSDNNIIKFLEDNIINGQN